MWPNPDWICEPAKGLITQEEAFVHRMRVHTHIHTHKHTHARTHTHTKQSKRPIVENGEAKIGIM